MQTSRRIACFDTYLRTGRLVDPRAIEVKFNPWHDAKDGRFTFVGRGNYFPGHGPSGSNRAQQSSGFGGGGAQGSWEPHNPHDPKNANNHGWYTVQRGDTLTRIARFRKGLTAADLAWLNDISLDRPLRIGQRIKVPHQRSLDAARDAKNKAVALDYYLQTHGGKLPPDPAKPPSLQSQILDANWRQEIRGSYNFYIDPGMRFRQVFGVITLAEVPKRSRKSQREVAERRPGDDGGHYIAARFNGPTDWFNHFAQDLKINRGAYRVMEDGWYKDAAAGRRVFVSIEAFYAGASRRPSHIQVIWSVDGKERFRSFPNEAKGGDDGKR
jgi:hypothetical protein